MELMKNQRMTCVMKLYLGKALSHCVERQKRVTLPNLKVNSGLSHFLTECLLATVIKLTQGSDRRIVVEKL